MKVIIAGGGTGGHLFPGIAIAEEFLSRNQKADILFVGTARGIENRILDKLGFRLKTIDIGGIAGKGIGESLRNILLIPRSMMQSLRIIKGFNPDLVIGVGGYASGPMLLTARLCGLKTAVAEQNAIPGITNRISGVFVQLIFLTYPDTAGWFPRTRTILSGNPVRKELLNFQPEGPGEGGFTILIFGGSQGAEAINDAFLAALPHLKGIIPNLRIIHQTGSHDWDYAAKVYQNHGVSAEVQSFIMNMAQAYGRADLIICRAGATSIAEITALGRAAVLIPYPYAAHDHQTKNALALTRRGAAEFIPEGKLDGRKLAKIIIRLYQNPQMMNQLKINAAALGNPKAAARIVDECTRLVERGSRQHV